MTPAHQSDSSLKSNRKFDRQHDPLAISRLDLRCLPYREGMNSRVEYGKSWKIGVIFATVFAALDDCKTTAVSGGWRWLSKPSFLLRPGMQHCWA